MSVSINQARALPGWLFEAVAQQLPIAEAAFDAVLTTAPGTAPSFAAKDALQAARRTIGAVVAYDHRDNRCVGWTPDDEPVRMWQLWHEAALAALPDALIFSMPADAARFARAVALAADAEACADYLGIRPTDSADEAHAELERVGLIGLVEGAELAKIPAFRGLGPR